MSDQKCDARQSGGVNEVGAGLAGGKKVSRGCRLSRDCVTDVPRIAVGMPITEHPPHRTGRAAFPHPAPTLDV
jgi:hypothetical protein